MYCELNTTFVHKVPLLNAREIVTRA